MKYVKLIAAIVAAIVLAAMLLLNPGDASYRIFTALRVHQAMSSVAAKASSTWLGALDPKYTMQVIADVSKRANEEVIKHTVRHDYLFWSTYEYNGAWARNAEIPGLDRNIKYLGMLGAFSVLEDKPLPDPIDWSRKTPKNLFDDAATSKELGKLLPSGEDLQQASKPFYQSDKFQNKKGVWIAVGSDSTGSTQGIMWIENDEAKWITADVDSRGISNIKGYGVKISPSDKGNFRFEEALPNPVLAIIKEWAAGYDPD